MSVHQRKDGQWFAKWIDSGKERRRYFGKDEAAAKRWDYERKAAKEHATPASHSIHSLCQEYHRRHIVQASTAEVDAYRITRHIIPKLGQAYADALTSEHLDGYVHDRMREGAKRTTIDRELDILRSAYNWGERQVPPLVLRNIMRSFRVSGKDDRDKPMPPTKEEVERLLEAAPGHLKRAITLHWYCGMRPGKEVLGIKWSDVNWDLSQIRIMSAKKGAATVRFVPMKEALKNVCLVWVDQDKKLISPIHNINIVHYNLRPVRSLKTAWKETKRRAGITRRLRQYDLRHAMVTIALRMGAPLKWVSEIVGHTTVNTTMMVYQHVNVGDHWRVAEKIPDLQSTSCSTKSDSD